MAGISTIILLGIVIGSISFSMFLFLDNQIITLTPESSESVKVGGVNFDVQYIANYEKLEKTEDYKKFEETQMTKGLYVSEVPEGIYFQIQITAHNTGTETVEITGGNFFLYDIDNNKYEALFVGYGDSELSVLNLEPNNSAIVTTQFDILYDDKMEYTVGIIPDRFGLQNAKERVFVCITNC